MQKKLIRKTDVCDMTGLSYGTIRRLFLLGKFPKPVQLTPGGSIAWFQNEVAEWIDSLQKVTPETMRVVAPGSLKRGRPSRKSPQLERRSR